MKNNILKMTKEIIEAIYYDILCNQFICLDLSDNIQADVTTYISNKYLLDNRLFFEVLSIYYATRDDTLISAKLLKDLILLNSKK